MVYITSLQFVTYFPQFELYAELYRCIPTFTKFCCNISAIRNVDLCANLNIEPKSSIKEWKTGASTREQKI